MLHYSIETYLFYCCYNKKTTKPIIDSGVSKYQNLYGRINHSDHLFVVTDCTAHQSY